MLPGVVMGISGCNSSETIVSFTTVSATSNHSFKVGITAAEMATLIKKNSVTSSCDKFLFVYDDRLEKIG